MTVAITQPDFFPWLGSIDKILKADIFIFLDDVRNRTSDGLYTKRVKILINKEPRWLTVPLKKGKEEFTRIMDMEIETNSDFAKKHIDSIIFNYKKAPHFSDIFPLVEEFYLNKKISIAQRNIDFIQSLCQKINFPIPSLLSSSYNLTSKSNQLLIDLVKAVGADKYMYGGGSMGYLDFDLWKENNLELVAQDFRNPSYRQFNVDGFIPGLSIIDVLFNLGFKGTEGHLKGKAR